MRPAEALNLWAPRAPGKQCRGKARYDSEYDAAMFNAEHHGPRSPLEPYLCPHCDFWHLGHPIRVEAT